MRKISNVKVAESAVTVILKKLSQLSGKRKSSHSYHKIVVAWGKSR